MSKTPDKDLPTNVLSEEEIFLKILKVIEGYGNGKIKYPTPLARVLADTVKEWALSKVKDQEGVNTLKDNLLFTMEKLTTLANIVLEEDTKEAISKRWGEWLRDNVSNKGKKKEEDTCNCPPQDRICNPPSSRTKGMIKKCGRCLKPLHKSFQDLPTNVLSEEEIEKEAWSRARTEEYDDGFVDGYKWALSKVKDQEEPKEEKNDVYSRSECVFHYCSHPETCKGQDKCQNPK